MKTNSGKIHFLRNDKWKCYGDHTTISENKNELLGIVLDPKLSFEDHINNLCKQPSQKIKALARIAPYSCLGKRKIVMKAYIISQFRYYTLFWMFHSIDLNFSAWKSIRNNIRWYIVFTSRPVEKR